MIMRFWGMEKGVSPTREVGGAGDPFAIPLRAGSSLRLKNGYAQDDTVICDDNLQQK
jgi:hypothetical protein